jgi:putative ATP-binding cassette transporter
VLLFCPDFLFLDEATCSLNEDAERALFSLLFAELPGTAVVSVTHRETPNPSFQRILEISPANKEFHASKFSALTRPCAGPSSSIPS